MNKIYLGDGVYVEQEEGMLVLTANDETGRTNMIWMERMTYEALVAYVQSLERAADGQ